MLRRFSSSLPFPKASLRRAAAEGGDFVLFAFFALGGDAGDCMRRFAVDEEGALPLPF